MMVLSVNADDTAPVPAKMSAIVSISEHSSLTTFVMKGSSLYLLPKYLLLLIKDVLYVFVSATLICVSSAYTLYQLYNIASPIKWTLYVLKKLG